VGTDLNRLIQGPGLYDADAFREAGLKKNTLNLLSKVTQHPNPADLAFLNRQLVEQALPGAIVPLQSYIDKVRSRVCCCRTWVRCWGWLPSRSWPLI